MTTIIEHGNWVAYKPDPLPLDAPANALFCERTSDGKDWYEYQKESPFLNTGTAKCTIYSNIVQAVNRDASTLFPQGALLGEFETEEADPQAAYGGWTYDPATKTISYVKPPDPGGGGDPDPMDVAILANQRITNGVNGAVEEYNALGVMPAAPTNPEFGGINDRMDRLERTLKQMCRELMMVKGVPAPSIKFNDDDD